MLQEAKESFASPDLSRMTKFMLKIVYWNSTKVQQAVFLSLESYKHHFPFWLMPVNGAMDQNETLQILMLKTPFICQGAICQVCSSGFNDTSW